MADSAQSSAVLHSNAPFGGWSWAAGRLPSGGWQVVGGQPTREHAEQALRDWFTANSATCIDHPDRLATTVLHEEDDETVWVSVCDECAEHAV